MKLKKSPSGKRISAFPGFSTNQQFVVLENKKKEELGKEVQFDFWEKYDEDHTVIRFATSWGTKMEDIDALIEVAVGLSADDKRDEMEKLREVRVNADLTEFLFSKIITSYPSQQLR